VRCVLVHGLNGEPADLDEVERALRREGFATHSLLLPGHGTTVRTLRRSRWADWLGEVRRAAREVLGAGERLMLVGHSMGAAACLAVAAEYREEPALVGVAALCPPTRMHPGAEGLFGAMRHITPYLPGGIEDIRNRRARARVRRHVYRWTATEAIYSLLLALPDVRAALPRVCCPVLVVAAKHDHVVPLRDGLEAYGLLGAREKELLVLERSYHAVAQDVERHIVSARVAAFCRRVSVDRSQVSRE
jgi:carboxylesterase